MTFGKVLLSLFVPLSLAAGLTLSDVVSAPVYGQVSTAQISESKSALAGAKTALSDFDGKLEFPLSAPEKSVSQKALNQYQASFSIKDPGSITGSSVLKLAKETLETARAAGKEAEGGDRTRAIARFTEARKLLYKTNRYLSVLENQSITTSPGQKKLLNARARKDDQLLVADQGSPDKTNVSITPGNIHVREGSGNSVQTTNINMSPDRITISDHGHTSTGSSSTVEITPGRIHVRDAGLNSNSTVSINTTPGAIDLNNLGQSISNLVNGTVGSALNTAQVATNTALGSTAITTNRTGTTLRSSGKAISITGHDNTRTIKLNGEDLTVTGHTNKVTVYGHCGNVTVTGHDNIVNLNGVKTISVSGHDNSVYWKYGTNGSNPGINMLGRQNTISRVH